jgi:hypothetical protein
MSLSACDIGNPIYEISRSTEGGSINSIAKVYHSNDGESSVDVPISIDYDFDFYGLNVRVYLLQEISITPDDINTDLREAAKAALEERGIDDGFQTFKLC